MKIGAWGTAVLVAVFFMAATPVLAQTVCVPRSEFVETLAENYDEAPVAYGLTNGNDRLIELFVSKDGKTWTLIITYPNGQSCSIVAGHDWRSVLPKLLKPMGQPI